MQGIYKKYCLKRIILCFGINKSRIRASNFKIICLNSCVCAVLVVSLQRFFKNSKPL